MATAPSPRRAPKRAGVETSPFRLMAQVMGADIVGNDLFGANEPQA